MYANDSFFTLSLAGKLGLLTLPAALSLTIFVVSWQVVWLNPQAYYTYYLFLFEGLEFKNVIKSPPTVQDIYSLMTFSDRANFSNYGKGLLSWSMIILSIMRTHRHPRSKRQTKVQAA